MAEYPDLDKYRFEPDTTLDYPTDKDYKGFTETLFEDKLYGDMNQELKTKLKQMRRIVEKKLLEDFCAAFKKKYYYHIVHQLTEQHYKDIVEEFLDERSKSNE